MMQDFHLIGDSVEQGAKGDAQIADTSQEYGLHQERLVVNNNFDFLKTSRIYNCYPGGNDTYIIYDPAIKRESYAELNKSVLSYGTSKDICFEQGGFIERAQSQFAVARLQMAGGEFCGNAARSFGALLISDYLGKRNLASVVQYEGIRQQDDRYSLLIEMSGTDRLLEVSVKEEGEEYKVRVEVPIRHGFQHIRSENIFVSGNSIPVQVVELEGITHIIVSGDKLKFPTEESVRNELARTIIADLGLVDHPAVGVIWSDTCGDSRRINPVVWVKSIDSYFYESACGSGSVAAGLVDTLSRSAIENNELRILQPSGYAIDVSIEVSSDCKAFSKAYIDGSVILKGEISPRTEKAGQEFVTPRTLKGFRDRLPTDAIFKGHMLTALRGVFEQFGYAPIETPHLEYAEGLLGGASREIKKQLYRFNDNGGRDVLLRFDLTVPFARFISQHKNELGVPFKRWAIGNVFRGENTQAGRFREFTQCDFDFVGTTSIGADAEVVQVMAASMESLGVTDFTIRINNRRLMNALTKALGIEETTADVLQIVDKIDKIGHESVRQELINESRITPAIAEKILEFVTLSKDSQGAELFEKVRSFSVCTEEIAEATREIEALFDILERSGADLQKFKVDFSIARGLGYYTGIVYETTLNQLPRLGSVCSGGRYDNLTQTFSSDPLPGVGASVGIDRLIAGLEQLGTLSKVNTPAVGLVVTDVDGDMAMSHKIARELRQMGLNIEVYPEAEKVGKQVKYATKRGHQFLISTDSRKTEIMIEDLNHNNKRSFEWSPIGVQALKLAITNKEIS